MTVSLTSQSVQPGARVDLFEIVAQTLVDECGVPREQITPESNIADDLGLDSLSFLDVCYALDSRLGITIPYEQWVNDINSGKIDAKKAFVLKNIIAQIEPLLAESDEPVAQNRIHE